MQTRVITQPEITTLIEEMLRAFIVREIKTIGDIGSLTVLTGDRVTCCDEAIVPFEDPSLGIQTIAYVGSGENGAAALVGIYVRPEGRNRGVGSALVRAAIERCVERRFGRICTSIFTEEASRIFARLPQHLRSRLEICDVSAILLGPLG